MAKKLWGGRFRKEMHPKLKAFSYSLAVDGNLFHAELRVNEAYVKMLARAGLLTGREKKKLLRAIGSVKRQFSHRDLASFASEFEDVHSFIQYHLEREAGEAAKKIHTGRSRNDLVVTSTRLWLKEEIAGIDRKIAGLQQSLVRAARKTKDAVIAGLTHLRRAQPVLLAHHLLAYVEMIEEDRERLADAARRTDVLALGAASLGGSSLPIDRKFLARELGFSKISANSLAAVSDRAFCCEFLSGIAILWMHFSRLSEDFILWNSEPFGYLELDDAFATGSSLMPQKKNPDVFELLRGGSAAMFGRLQSLLVLQKGLPLAYNRDLQEDKAALFEAVRKTRLALEVLALTIDSAGFNSRMMEASVLEDEIYATDVAEYLVRKKIPFSLAHTQVGQMVRIAREREIPLREFPLAELKKINPVFENDVFDLFNPKFSVRSKKTYGSTHPSGVLREILRWEQRLSGGRARRGRNG